MTRGYREFDLSTELALAFTGPFFRHNRKNPQVLSSLTR